MRLIDADALIDDLKHDVAVDQDSLDYEELTDSNRENIQFDKDCKQNAIDLLQNAPTIEPERKKGKWIPDNNSVYEMRFVCSECKESQVVPTIGFTKYKPIWDFCPNCGADMTEGEG